MAQTDVADRLLCILTEFEALTSELVAGDAPAGFDETTLEVFWRDWPSLRSWAERLWQRLDDELAVPATPVTDPELDEIGDGG